MSDKEYNNFMKVLMISVGAVIVIVTLFLYFGGEGVKSSLCCKIFLSIFMGLILISAIIAICCCPCEREATFSISCRDQIEDYDTGVVFVHQYQKRRGSQCIIP